jgi:hypothetical protein
MERPLHHRRSSFLPMQLCGVEIRSFLPNRQSDAGNLSGQGETRHRRSHLYIDRRGMNLRNDLAHGLVPIEAFNQSVADRVFHSLLVLSLLQNKETAAPKWAPLYLLLLLICRKRQWAQYCDHAAECVKFVLSDAFHIA